MPKSRFFKGVSRHVLTRAAALLAVGTLAVVSVASVAFAQAGSQAGNQASGAPADLPPPPPHMRPKFSDLDVNKDGVIDKTEFAAPLSKPFADMDTNKDGVISQAEFDAFKPPHGPEDGPGMGHGDHPDRHDGGPDGHMPPPPGGPDGPEHGPDPKDLDTNKDGKITLDEFLAPAKAHFAKLDANHDGVLEADELPKPPMRGDVPPPPPASKDASSK